jgi:hypothetical protein
VVNRNDLASEGMSPVWDIDGCCLGRGDRRETGCLGGDPGAYGNRASWRLLRTAGSWCAR